MRVVIPDELLEAIAAVGGMPLTVQTRRDVPLFLLAVKACAAIHMARRQRDAEGTGDRGVRGLRCRARRHRRLHRGGVLVDAQAAGDRRCSRR